MLIFSSDSVEYEKIAQLSGSILELRESPNKKIIIAGDSTGECVLVDAEKARLLHKWSFSKSAITGLSISADHSKIASANIDGKILIFTPDDGKIVSQISTDQIDGEAVELQFNETVLMAHLANGDVITVNISSGEITDRQFVGLASGMPFPITIRSSVLSKLSQAGFRVSEAGTSGDGVFVPQAVRRGDSGFIIGTSDGSILNVAVKSYALNRVILSLILVGAVIGLVFSKN